MAKVEHVEVHVDLKELNWVCTDVDLLLTSHL